MKGGHLKRYREKTKGFHGQSRRPEDHESLGIIQQLANNVVEDRFRV